MSDRRGAFAAHRAAASGLFTLFTLIAIVLGLGDARPLALAMGGALGTLFVLTRENIRDSLGDFAAPLAMVADLALLFCAMSLTGGALSPYALLLPAGVALSWHCEGKPAARFFAVASVMGVAALATLARVPTDSAASLFALAGVALAAPALLVTLEVVVGGGRKARRGRHRRGVRRRPRRSSPPLPRRRPPRSRSATRRPRSSTTCDLPCRSSASTRTSSRKRRAGASCPIGSTSTTSRARSSSPSGSSEPRAAAPEPPAPPPGSADLVEILGSLATAYRLAHGGRIRIEFIAERPQLPVAADPVALQRAFRNVLDNAIKYTPDAGEVRIRAGAAGTQAFVVVKDTGMGMSPEESARAFDYAFRGQGAVASGRRGKGLGLAVTKEILEANGGKISLSSEAGYGSEVTIMLPFQRGAR